MTRQRQSLTALTVRVAAVSAVGVLAGCGGVMDPQGPVGIGNKQILLNAVAIMSLIVVPVILATLAFAIWYRHSNSRAKYRPDFVYSGRIEVVVWGIPAMVVLFLGGLAWTGSHELDPAKPLVSHARSVQVEVVSLDWKSLFIYPELGVASINELVIPAGTPVRFRLTSASVMTTFFVPQLGSMIYTMNGMATQLNLQADRPGVFRGMAAHYSGDGFPGMKFDVRSLSQPDFAAWAARTRNGGGRLDRAAYALLVRQTSNEPVATYGEVEPRLFDEVVLQTVPFGEGPKPKDPHTAHPAGSKG